MPRSLTAMLLSLLLISAVLLSAAAARADEVTLTNGARLQGEVEWTKAGLVLRQAHGKIVIPPSEVRGVVPTPAKPAPAAPTSGAPAAPAASPPTGGPAAAPGVDPAEGLARRRAALAADDVDGRLTLARAAEALGLVDAAGELYREADALAQGRPDGAAAQVEAQAGLGRLGWRRVGGRWEAPADYLPTHGQVKSAARSFVSDEDARRRAAPGRTKQELRDAREAQEAARREAARTRELRERAERQLERTRARRDAREREREDLEAELARLSAEQAALERALARERARRAAAAQVVIVRPAQQQPQVQLPRRCTCGQPPACCRCPRVAAPAGAGQVRAAPQVVAIAPRSSYEEDVLAQRLYRTAQQRARAERLLRGAERQARDAERDVAQAERVSARAGDRDFEARKGVVEADAAYGKVAAELGRD